MQNESKNNTETATLGGGYFELNQYQPYCQIVIAPKVAKVRERYLARLKRG
jgi:hypothetical protein